MKRLAIKILYSRYCKIADISFTTVEIRSISAIEKTRFYAINLRHFMADGNVAVSHDPRPLRE